MKIEKLNDHQIRCTLTIKLSELAYGSEKAKALFRDMMQQAAIDFGFEAEDIPIMIEAIPLSSEKIVLIISKVESPDELDTRFSNFTQADTDNENEDDDILSFGSDAFGDSSDQEPDETSMQLLDLLQQLKQAHKKEESSAKKKDTPSIPSDLVRLFTFRELDAAILAANTLQGFYQGKNTLYKDPQVGDYYLILHQSQHTIAEFNQVYHLISSYLQPKKYTTGTQAYYEEHFQKIINGNALQQLGEIA